MVKEKRIDSFFKRKRGECSPLGEGEAHEQPHERGAVREGPEPEPVTQETPVQPPLLLLEFGQRSHEEQGHQTHRNEVLFHGIQFLERDPALRAQIWQYPPNQRDEVRRAYLKLGPMQPRLQNYKSSGTQGHQRRFKYNWFSQFPSWLEYSESQDRAYCLFCFLSTKNKNKNKEHYFRVEIFRATLDTQLHELEFRLIEKVMDLLSTSATLIPSNKFRSFKADDICEMVKKYYPADFTQQEIYGLEQQLKHFVVDASSDNELRNVRTLTNLCRCLVETGRHSIYNLIDRLLRLIVTLPVSMTSAERTFSTLKIIKTRLRNKMEDEFLANSLLVNIEREITEKFSYEDVLDHFIGAKERRADL